MHKRQVYFEILRTTLALCVSVVISAIIIFLVSEEPLYALRLLLTGPFYTLRRFGNVIELSIPLIFTGLGLAIIFQSNQFNISVSGVFVIGAVASAVSAIFLPLPNIIAPILVLMIGSLVGSFFTLIPGVLKVVWNTSELVTSLMLNYVLYQLAWYTIHNFAFDVESVAPVSLKFKSNTLLPTLIPGMWIHSGLLIAVLVIGVIYIFLVNTRWGYAIKMTGLNSNFAHYSGIDTKKSVLLAQGLGGAVIGLGGGVEMLGMYKRFQWQVIPSFGFDGIIVALMARNSPLFIPLAAFMLAYIRIGADIMSRNTDVPSELVLVIQAVIMVMIVAERFLFRLKYRLIAKESLAQMEKKSV